MEFKVVTRLWGQSCLAANLKFVNKLLTVANGDIRFLFLTAKLISGITENAKILIYIIQKTKVWRE